MTEHDIETEEFSEEEKVCMQEASEFFNQPDIPNIGSLMSFEMLGKLIQNGLPEHVLMFFRKLPFSVPFSFQYSALADTFGNRAEAIAYNAYLPSKKDEVDTYERLAQGFELLQMDADIREREIQENSFTADTYII